MSKVDIKRLDSVTKNDTTATEQINDNFQALQAAIENTVSRDGAVPNYMDADLDLNSYRIINAGAPVEGKDVVTLEYFEEKAGGAIEAAAEAKASASKAASSAQSALVASNNAIGQLAQAEGLLTAAEGQLADTKQYVDAAKADIDATVATGKQDINTTIDEASMRLSDTIEQAVEDVKAEAVAAAEGAIQDAADTATQIATNQVNEYTMNAVVPQLNTIVSNAEADASNAAESAEIASNKATEATNEADEAKHWAEDSRVWATGEDAEVEEIAPGEEEHSSRGYADLAMAIANTPEDVPVDTSKLMALQTIKGPKGDKGDKGDKGADGKDGADGKSVFDGYATNCITEIPQDIKLELNNGTLTLKAGSKVYIPKGKDSSGNNIFSEYTTLSDLSFAASSLGSTKRFVCYTNNSIIAGVWEAFTSGTTVPSVGYCYHSEENKIYRDGAVVNDMSLPLMFGDYVQNSGFASIDQVFNGFGYIGSTVFALPGVKGLIPDGRNADGSLKNVEFVTSKVVTHTYGSETYGTFDLTLKNDNTFNWYKDFNVKKDNYCYDGDTKIASKVSVGKLTINSSSDKGKIAFLSTKLPFRAVDYNEASGLGMPSSKYVDLTLGASGATYTAPANGWFTINKHGASGQIVALENRTAGGVTWIACLGKESDCRVSCPAKKGDNIIIWFDATGAINVFRFVYCEGDK